jgi:hypothetical protein
MRASMEVRQRHLGSQRHRVDRYEMLADFRKLSREAFVDTTALPLE